MASKRSDEMRDVFSGRRSGIFFFFFLDFYILFMTDDWRCSFRCSIPYSQVIREFDLVIHNI